MIEYGKLFLIFRSASGKLTVASSPILV